MLNPKEKNYKQREIYILTQNPRYFPCSIPCTLPSIFITLQREKKKEGKQKMRRARSLVHYLVLSNKKHPIFLYNVTSYTRLYNDLRREQPEHEDPNEKFKYDKMEPKDGVPTGYKLFAIAGIATFSYLLYLTMTRESRFNRTLDYAAKEKELMEQFGISSEQGEHSGIREEDTESFSNFKTFMNQVARKKDIYGVIELQNAEENESLKRLYLAFQSNSYRDLDIILVDALDYQTRYQSHVSQLYQSLNAMENTARMRVLKGTNRNRPLVLLISNANAADNNILGVLRLYAHRWSKEPDRFGIAIAFAGTTLKYRFKDDKVWFWNFPSPVIGSMEREGFFPGGEDNFSFSDEMPTKQQTERYD